jgi:flagellar biosynthesis/type III secretory pathway M-ring protein FliF/YscJ
MIAKLAMYIGIALAGVAVILVIVFVVIRIRRKKAREESDGNVTETCGTIETVAAPEFAAATFDNPYFMEDIQSEVLGEYRDDGAYDYGDSNF